MRQSLLTLAPAAIGWAVVANNLPAANDHRAGRADRLEVLNRL